MGTAVFFIASSPSKFLSIKYELNLEINSSIEKPANFRKLWQQSNEIWCALSPGNKLDTSPSPVNSQNSMTVNPEGCWESYSFGFLFPSYLRTLGNYYILQRRLSQNVNFSKHSVHTPWKSSKSYQEKVRLKNNIDTLGIATSILILYFVHRIPHVGRFLSSILSQ